MAHTEQHHAIKRHGVYRGIYIALVFIAPPLFWAGNFIVGKAIRNDISPTALTFCRWLVAFGIILPFAIPFIKRDAQLYRQYAGWLLAVSLSGVMAFSLLVYVALHHTSGTNALLLNSCVPVLIMLFAALFFGYKLRLLQILGLLISCTGVLTIIFRGEIVGLLQMKFESGDLLLLSAMACFSFYTLWLKNIPQEINRTGLLCMQALITVILMMPLMLIQFNAGITPDWNTKTTSAILFLGIFPSFLSYLCYSRCIAEIGASRAGLCIYLIPVFGVALSSLYLGESFQTYQATGIVIILSGVVLAGLFNGVEKKQG